MHYRAFYKEIHNSEAKLPYTEVDVLWFIAYLQRRMLSSSTIIGYVSAISFLHRINGLKDCTQSFIVKKTLQGLRKQEYKKDTRLPITKDIVRKICEVAPMVLQNAYDVQLIRAFSLVAFYGFFRIGELVTKNSENVVQLSSVQFSNDLMSITIPRSKASLFPEVVNIRNQSPSCMCPINVTKMFLSRRGDTEGPLFAHPDGTPFTYTYIKRILTTILSFLGLDLSRYKGHSFRIGAATEAANAGFSDAQIRLMGRWKSDAFKRYIRPTLSVLGQVTTTSHLGGVSPTPS
jgi:hypothetical protein